MKTLNYSTHLNKREIQKEILSKVSDENIVTLLGPSLKNYINFLKRLGFKKVISYEKDKEIFLLQLNQIKKYHNISLNYGDIITNLPRYKNVVYDIDLCCSIVSTYELIPKLKGLKFLITLSVRPIGIDKTIKIFENLSKLKKDKEFIYYTYFDKTSMIIITNIF